MPRDGFGTVQGDYMLATVMLAASLITTPAPPAKSEAECIRLYPDQWDKIVDCVAPAPDLDANPRLKLFFAACGAATEAAAAEGVEMRSAVFVIDGKDYECVRPGVPPKEPGA